MTDRPLVAVRLAPGARWLSAVAAVWESGGAVLPLPVDGDDHRSAATVAALRPSRMITATGEAELEGGAPVREGTALVLATSGSTGVAKGVELSHAALEWSARASLDRLGATSDDRWLCCLPLHHVAGVQVLTRSRLLGVEPVILAGFDPEAVARHREVTMVALVPTMLRRLLDAGTDLSHLRCVVLGGAPAGAALLDDARRHGLRVVTTYGMTETCGGCVYDGIPLAGASARLTDQGRIQLRGPMLFSGYRGDLALTAAVMREGWLHTADLGRWSPEGRLEIVGRTDDMIITGGENVPAAHVAELLELHPAVDAAAVVGLDDPEWGQRVVAVVVPAGSRPPVLADLRSFVAERAARHAAPRQLVAVPSLPRLATGKIDRTAVRRLAAAAPPRP